MVLLRGEEKFMNFRIQEKLMLWMSRSKKNLFQRKKLVERWSFRIIYETCTAQEMRRRMLQFYIKKTKKKRWGDIFFSMEYHVYWQLKGSCFEYCGDEKCDIFDPKSWWKYDIYWLLKVLVLNFSLMENTIFLQVKKLMGR